MFLLIASNSLSIITLFFCHHPSLLIPTPIFSQCLLLSASSLSFSPLSLLLSQLHVYVSLLFSLYLSLVSTSSSSLSSFVSSLLSLMRCILSVPVLHSFHISSLF